ncbi:MAG: lysyl-tRNA synthetase [Pedococcus sp.]
MNIWPYVAALIPSAGVGFLFYLVIKNMLEGDRKERLAHSQWEAAHRENDDNSTPSAGADNSR